MIGTVVNALAIALGAAIGLIFRAGIPERVRDTVMQGLGLAVMVIGLSMALETSAVLLQVVSLVAGGTLGAWLDLDGRVSALGRRLEAAVGARTGPVGRAFVTTSILYCTGAMAIVGAIEDGLLGRPDTLLAKAGIDGVASIMFSAAMGVGVMLSAVPVLIYQGAISLAAGHLEAFLTPAVVSEVSATGGILIIGIGLDVLGISRVRTVNLLPAIAAAAVLAHFFA